MGSRSRSTDVRTLESPLPRTGLDQRRGGGGPAWRESERVGRGPRARWGWQRREAQRQEVKRKEKSRDVDTHVAFWDSRTREKTVFRRQGGRGEEGEWSGRKRWRRR